MCTAGATVAPTRAPGLPAEPLSGCGGCASGAARGALLGSAPIETMWHARIDRFPALSQCTIGVVGILVRGRGAVGGSRPPTCRRPDTNLASSTCPRLHVPQASIWTPTHRDVQGNLHPLPPSHPLTLAPSHPATLPPSHPLPQGLHLQRGV